MKTLSKLFIYLLIPSFMAIAPSCSEKDNDDDTTSNNFSAGEWNDIAESNKLYYIIEFETSG